MTQKPLQGEAAGQPAAEAATDTPAEGARRGSFVTAEDVAARAGVSRSAVSRTFTPGASVSDETRRRVLAAASDLGYHVNHLVRGLVRGRTGIVCLVAANIDAPQVSRMVRAVSGCLQSSGLVSMLMSIEGPGDDAASVLRQTLNYRAEATVILSGTPAESLVRTCLDNGQRLILINRDDRISGPDNIRLDNASAARTALRAFLQGGCRRLAVVNSELGTPSLAAREFAFVASAHALGLEVEVVRRGLVTAYEYGQSAARDLFTGSRPPDGVFCVNDLLAFGVMDTARSEFGLRVPEDVSVIGFDNVGQAGWLSYGLTTFDHPVQEIGREVVRLIEQEATPEPVRIELPAPFVWRRSVRVDRKAAPVAP
jgi:DNA-binding LacI/PurR family transcriptional regulator